MTKLVVGAEKRVRTVRGRGGNLKFRALRLETGNFSWRSESKLAGWLGGWLGGWEVDSSGCGFQRDDRAVRCLSFWNRQFIGSPLSPPPTPTAVAKKTRILDVVYNASNNELVRTKTLVKSAIVQVDATPFRQYYEQHYGQEVGKKKKGAAKKEGEGEVRGLCVCMVVVVAALPFRPIDQPMGCMHQPQLAAGQEVVARAAQAGAAQGRDREPPGGAVRLGPAAGLHHVPPRPERPRGWLCAGGAGAFLLPEAAREEEEGTEGLMDGCMHASKQASKQGGCLRINSSSSRRCRACSPSSSSFSCMQGRGDEGPQVRQVRAMPLVVGLR